MTRDPSTSDVGQRLDTGTTMVGNEENGLSLDGRVRRLIQQGDVRGALCQIVQTHGDSVYKFCCVTLGDAALAEDVQQQIFMEVFRDLSTFRYRSSIRTWLFGIVHHRVWDAVKMRRRAQARLATGNTDELANEPDPGPSADESIDDTRLRNALLDSLRDLSEPVLTAVLLRFQQGYTFEQIARVCGDTPGTHHARVTRALRRLREGIETRIAVSPGTRSLPIDANCRLPVDFGACPSPTKRRGKRVVAG